MAKPRYDNGPCYSKAADRLVRLFQKKCIDWDELYAFCHVFGNACEEYGVRLGQGKVVKRPLLTHEEVMARLGLGEQQTESEAPGSHTAD